MHADKNARSQRSSRARGPHASRYGVVINGEVGINMETVQGRAEKVTLDARSGLETWLDGLENMSVIYGHGRFEDRNTVIVNDSRVTAPQMFINVGARPSIPDYPGLDEVPYLTSTSIIHLTIVPRHLVVIGGSYIGLEFAQMYRRFGAQVTVVERGPHIASHEDEDVSNAIASIMEAEGITVQTEAANLSFRKTAADIEVTTNTGAILASHVLIATGRRPNTDDLGLENAGVEIDQKGFIVVDDRLSTTVPGIWALGDCNGHGAFTHTSYNDFEIVAANLLDGADRKLSDRVPAYALYIDPPLGRVGMSELQARESGRQILVSTRPMTRVGRAVEKDETHGFMKLVADAETLQILGATILGIESDEAIHGIIDAMNAKTPYPTLKWSVPIHPTVSELIPTLIGDLRSPE